MVWIVIVLCLVYDCFIVRDFFRKKDLSLINLFSLGCSVYYLIIPLNSCIWGDKYRGVLISTMIGNSLLMFICFLVFKTLLCFLNYLCLNKLQLRFLNLTKPIRICNKKIRIPSNHIFLYLIFVLAYAFLTLSYSEMNIEVRSEDSQLITIRTSKLESLFDTFLYYSMPTIIVLTLKYIKERSRDYRFIAIFTFILGLITLAVGSRTTFLFTIVCCISYLYSVDKNSFTTKRMLYFVSLAIVCVLVLFPLLKVYRMVRVDLMLNSSHHSLLSIVNAIMSSNISSLFDYANSQNTTRSLNVFIAFYESFYNNYRSSEGYWLTENMLSLFPLYSPDPKLYSLFARILENGGDIGDSLLTSFIVDMGKIGFLLAPVYIIIYWSLIYLICKLTFVFIKIREIFLLELFLSFSFCVKIEAFFSVRQLYNTYLLSIVVFAIIFYMWNLISSTKQHNNLFCR